MRKLILHIGMQKTGTSSLQKFLLHNREKLLEAGFLYPLAKIGGTPAHHFFAEAAQNSAISQLDAGDALSSLRETYRPLIEEIKRHPTSIVSSESFQNCNPYIIRELFVDFDVTVVFYIRNEVDFITSAYAQRIHATTSNEKAEEYVSRSEINYGPFLDGWSSAFDGQINPRIFAKEFLRNGDIIEDFLLEFLGLGSEGFDFLTEDGNPSLTNATLKAKFHLNELYEYPSQLRHLVYSYFQQAALKDNRSGKVKLDEKLLFPLIDRFQKLQSYWAPKYFGESEIFKYELDSAKQTAISPKEIHAIIQPIIAKSGGKIQPKGSVRIESKRSQDKDSSATNKLEIDTNTACSEFLAFDRSIKERNAIPIDNKEKVPLKIVVKTKNDSFFLRSWIDHHSRIVGIENLIIVDNFSDSADTLKIYNDYRHLLILQHSYYFNAIHDREKFSEFYHFLESTCTHYLFIDTDEFLTYFDCKTGFDPLNVTKFVRDNADEKVICTLWGQALPSEQDKSAFDYRKDPVKVFFPDYFEQFIKGGKPIFKSNYTPNKLAIHSSQVNPNDISPQRIRLLLVHLKNYNARARVKVIFDKIKSQGYQFTDGAEMAAWLHTHRDEFAPATEPDINYMYNHYFGENDDTLDQRENFRFTLCNVGQPIYWESQDRILSDFLDKFYSKQDLLKILT